MGENGGDESRLLLLGLGGIKSLAISVHVTYEFYQGHGNRKVVLRFYVQLVDTAVNTRAPGNILHAIFVSRILY